MRIKDGGNNDAIPDLMIEVGLDGTIYNYHSHRKDPFIGHGSIYRQENLRNITCCRC
jgi:hypothetical protein